MLREICFIKIVVILFAFSVSSSDDYESLKNVFYDEDGHTKSTFNKHSDYILQQKYDDDNSIEIGLKQGKYNELLEQLRMVLTLISRNPNYIIYITDIQKPMYNIDLRFAEDLDPDNDSLILRRDGMSDKDKKGSDSSASSEISDDNEKDNLRYESCRRGRKKCVKACKTAYREACYYETCWRWLRKMLRKMCKKSCRRWFS